MGVQPLRFSIVLPITGVQLSYCSYRTPPDKISSTNECIDDIYFVQRKGRSSSGEGEFIIKRRSGNNSILAIEMNVVATSASIAIAIVISFINKIMRRCPPTTKQLYPELSVRIPSRLKRGEDAEEDGSEGK